eukprot:2129742-Amphidinium_carterae.1
MRIYTGQSFPSSITFTVFTNEGPMAIRQEDGHHTIQRDCGTWKLSQLGWILSTRQGTVVVASGWKVSMDCTNSVGQGSNPCTPLNRLLTKMGFAALTWLQHLGHVGCYPECRHCWTIP